MKKIVLSLFLSLLFSMPVMAQVVGYSKPEEVVASKKSATVLKNNSTSYHYADFYDSIILVKGDYTLKGRRIYFYTGDNCHRRRGYILLSNNIKARRNVKAALRSEIEFFVGDEMTLNVKHAGQVVIKVRCKVNNIVVE